MPDTLALVDRQQTLVADSPAGREYLLAVRIDGLLSRPTHEHLGPALSALYAQTLAAAVADRTLGGLVIDVREGQSEVTEDTVGSGLEVEIARDPYTAPTATFGLHLSIPYWQSDGAPAKRNQILEALAVAVAGNVPTVATSVREQALVAFRAHLAAAIGGAILRNADRPERLAAAAPGPVILLDGDQQVDHDTMGQTFYELLLPIEVFVAGTEADLDARIQQVLGALRSADTLGGLVVDVTEDSTNPEVIRDLYTGPGMGARLEGRIFFATAVSDPWTVAA